MNRMFSTKNIAYAGVLAAFAFGLGYIEMLIPSIGVPGAKLGLANLAVMTALYLLSPAEAAAVSLIRIVLSWLIFGSFTGFIYSLLGGAFSLVGMILIKKTDKFSPVGVSVVGGVCHNLGQTVAGTFMLGSGVWGYFPLLLAFGTLSGGITGLLGSAIIKALKKVKT